MTENLYHSKKKSALGLQITASLNGLLLVMSFCLFSVVAFGQTKLWDKTYGGSEYDALNEMLLTSDGGFLLAGTSGSGLEGTKTEATRGFWDFWLVKVDATGQKLWDKTYGGSDYERLTVLLKTQDGGYILGGSSFSPKSGEKSDPNQGSNDIWIIKVDATGNKIWDKTFGGNAYDELDDMIPTQDGGFLLGGTSNYSISGDKSENSRGRDDFWVIKIDGNGQKVWDKTIGGSEGDFLNTMVSTNDGGYLLGGSTLSGISGDKTTPQKRFCEEECSLDGWIVKIDASGNKLWDKTYGGFYGEYGDGISDIVPAKNGGFLVGGYSDSGISGDKTSKSRGLVDIWMFEIDASGTLLWDKAYGGSADEYLSVILPTNDGGYLVGGVSASGISGDKTTPSQNLYADSDDFWVFKIDSKGTKIWDQSFGGSFEDNLTSLIQISDGNYLLGGSSNSPISGQKTAPNFGSLDYWIVKMADDASCTTPTPSIAFTSTSTTYTGGNLNTLYLGYGPQSVTLTASGGLDYAWSPVVGLSSTSTAETVFTPTQAGVYTIRVTAANGACTATASVTITVTDVRCGPKNAKVMVCHNGKVICVAKDAVKAHLKNHLEDRLGECLADAPAVSKVAIPKPKVYPNPFTSSTTISFTLKESQDYTVEVYEFTGKLMQKWPSAKGKAGQHITLQWAPKKAQRGMYIVKLITKDGVQNVQVIKE